MSEGEFKERIVEKFAEARAFGFGRVRYSILGLVRFDGKCTIHV